MRIRPVCSTTNSRPLPSRALTSPSGLFRFVTTGSSRIDSPVGSKLPVGGGSDGLGDGLDPAVVPGLAEPVAPGLGGAADGPVVGEGVALALQATTASSMAAASAT